MSRPTIWFLVLGLISFFFDANGSASVSMEVGSTLLFTFMALVMISLIIVKAAKKKSTHRRISEHHQNSKQQHLI